MGSVFLQRIAANALKWPIITAKNAAEMLAWAIIIPADNFTNSHEWALCFYDEILPLPLDEPITVAEIATDGHEWPSVLARKAANTLEWAQLLQLNSVTDGYKWAYCL